MSAPIRILLFSVLVALIVIMGMDPQPLPAAEPGKTDVGYAVTANNELAFDLYKQLAKASGGKALFFSPYSISNALVIVAEGARNETAAEMGKVLRFPAAAQCAGADAAARPWDVDMIHPGLAALNDQFEAANRPTPPEVLHRLAVLHRELQAANQPAGKMMGNAMGNMMNKNAEPQAVPKARQKGKMTAPKAPSRARQIADEINRLQSQIDRYELRLANALWCERTYPFKNSYLDTIGKYYGFVAFPVDFRSDFETARRRINGWVEDRTRDHITNLLPAKSVDSHTTMVVTNAVYFKGHWATPFEARETKNLPFTLSDGKIEQVPTMYGYFGGGALYGAFNKDGSFFDTPKEVSRGSEDAKALYPEATGFEVLKLPYKGHELSMVVLAPRSAEGFAALEERITSGNLQGYLGKMRGRAINVLLPKFRMETMFDLKPTLEEMGMKRAFRDPREKDGAQFDGLSDAKDVLEKLYITKVLHKAYVEVGERGTEAAAATAVVTGRPKQRRSADGPLHADVQGGQAVRVPDPRREDGGGPVSG